MTGPGNDVTLIEHLQRVGAESAAELARRKARCAATGWPCDRDAVRAIDPAATDPALVDVPDHLMVRAELGRDF